MKAKSVKLISSSEYAVMDWKNGRGKTAEIAIFPPEASFPRDPFLWRLSSARIYEDGPFSRFPGYDRLLALVEGKGLALKFGEDGHGSQSLLRPGDFCCFSGDELVHGELVEGGVVDLNLIFKRDQVEAKLTILTSLTGPVFVPLRGSTIIFFVLAGSMYASFGPEAKGPSWKVKQGDTLIFASPEGGPWIVPDAVAGIPSLTLAQIEIGQQS